MNRDWIFELYRKVKAARDKELERILAILRAKATSDPDIQEALNLLELWAKRENGSNGTTVKTEMTTRSQSDKGVEE